MRLINEQVVHAVFGQGVICETGENVILVRFPEHGQKKFMFPEAFAGHLRAAEGGLQQQLNLLAEGCLAAQRAQKTQQQLAELAQKKAQTEECRLRYESKNKRVRKTTTTAASKKQAQKLPAAKRV